MSRFVTACLGLLAVLVMLFVMFRFLPIFVLGDSVE